MVKTPLKLLLLLDLAQIWHKEFENVINPKKIDDCKTLIFGGKGGIRTLDTVATV